MKREIHLKYASSASLIATLLSLGGSYFHMHISSSSLSFYQKFKSLSYHHLSLFFGLSSISWSGHQIHISLPANRSHRLLDSGIDPVLISCPQDFLFKDVIEIFRPLFQHDSALAKGVSILGSTGKLLNSATPGVFLAQVTAHHFYLALVFITSSVIGFRVSLRTHAAGSLPLAFNELRNSWHAQLSMNLAAAASLSLAFAHHIYAIAIYPSGASDYPRVLCLFYHHIWVGAFLILGAGAHASIFILSAQPSLYFHYSKNYCNSFILPELLNHRDLILGHLIWVSIALGLHSFSLYIHNDTLQAFGRREDIFDDNSIQLKPLFAAWVQSFA